SPCAPVRNERDVVVCELVRCRCCGAGRTLATRSTTTRAARPAALGLPVIHGAVPLSVLRNLDVGVDPFAFLLLQPGDQLLALDGQLGLDVLGSAFMGR